MPLLAKEVMGPQSPPKLPDSQLHNRTGKKSLLAAPFFSAARVFSLDKVRLDSKLAQQRNTIDHAGLELAFYIKG